MCLTRKFVESDHVDLARKLWARGKGGDVCSRRDVILGGLSYFLPNDAHTLAFGIRLWIRCREGSSVCIYRFCQKRRRGRGVCNEKCHCTRVMNLRLLLHRSSVAAFFPRTLHGQNDPLTPSKNCKMAYPCKSQTPMEFEIS